MAAEAEPETTDVDDQLLGEVQVELDRSANDLARLTDRLQEQTTVVERLELLVTEVLELVPTPAVVVDPDGRIAAVSRGARDALPRVSLETPGEQVTSVLPTGVAETITEVARSRTPASLDADPSTIRARDPSRWISVPGARVMPLPGGWALALLET